MTRFGSRVWAMAAKEALHIRRDLRTLYLALAMPVVLLLVFGYGVTFDLDDVPIVIVDQDGSSTSRALVRGLTAGEDLRLAAAPLDPDEVFAAFARGQALAAVVIPAGFEEAWRRGRPTEVQLLVDGADDNTARRVLAQVEGTIPVLLAGLRPPGSPRASPFEVRARTLFNPGNESVFFMVPGLVGYVLTMVAVLLTALTVAREWEEGSMAQLFATPVGRLEIILGKLLPYLVIGCLAVSLVMLFGMGVFHVPFRGSLAVFVLASLLFLAGMLGQGLLISVVTRNQMVATQAATLSSMLPSMLLSGFIFPIESMPWALRMLTLVIPARYYIECLRGVLLRGNGFGVLSGQLLALAIFAAFILALSVARFRRRLD